MDPAVLAQYAFGTSKVPSDSGIVVHAARLDGYKKYHVKDEYYPGIIPDTTTFVQGQVVYNLTDANVARLDEYEGDEYERKILPVYDSDLNVTVNVEVYVWIDSVDRLIEL